MTTSKSEKFDRNPNSFCQPQKQNIGGKSYKILRNPKPVIDDCIAKNAAKAQSSQPRNP